MAQFSFDIVSEYNKAEMNNVFDQTVREITNRYDFKGTSAAIDWLGSEKSGFKITGDNQYQLDAIVDIVRKKLASREQSQKVLDTSREPTTSNLKTTWEVPFKKGLDQERAKKITKLLRDQMPKVKAQIQGEEIRISSPKKDELQAVMDLIRKQDFDFPIIFTNPR
jgi:cyclic-di-GMP-binding protein